MDRILHMLQFHKDVFYVHCHFTFLILYYLLFIILYFTFLIQINDLSDSLTSTAKLFTDDTSLFSVVHNVNTSAKDLNDDLKKVNNLNFQSKMSFNPDLSKQTQEVIFSQKSKTTTHPPLVFKNNNVSQIFLQKHLSVISDFK